MTEIELELESFLTGGSSYPIDGPGYGGPFN